MPHQAAAKRGDMQSIRLGILFLILALIGFFLAREWHNLFPEGIELQARSDCDLAVEACTVQTPDGGHITLAISPNPIPLMQPLTVHVNGEGGLRPLHLDITGLNMEMGLNRTELSEVSAGIWQGETILPVCSQRRMHWEAALLLTDGVEQYRLAYSFHTLRP